MGNYIRTLNNFLRAELDSVAKKGTCRKKLVGTLILIDGEVAIRATNGPPAGFPTCIDGGCLRCSLTDFAPRMSYDLCICVHAEDAAIAEAARLGIGIEGAQLITSYQPCIMCAKLLSVAGIGAVSYLEPWFAPEKESGIHGLGRQYERLWKNLPGGCTLIT